MRTCHNARVDRVEATLLAEYPDFDLGNALAPPAAVWPTERFQLRHGTVMALDQTLAGVASRAISQPAGARLLAASPDLRLVVSAVSGDLVVLGEAEWRLPVPGADSAVILGSGQLLVTARVIPPGSMFASANRVLLLDPVAREILDEVPLVLNEAYIGAIAHPQDGSVLLDAGMGQDGSRVFAARAEGRRLTVSPVLENVVPGGFDPAGGRLLLVPHVTEGSGEASVVAWPSLEQVAAVTPGGIGLDGDELDYYGCFLDEDQVLLKTLGSGLLLCSGDLVPRGLVSLPGYGPDEGFEMGPVIGIAPGTFAAELEGGEAAVATVWRLPA
jgi:hypothetical protein